MHAAASAQHGDCQPRGSTRQTPAPGRLPAQTAAHILLRRGGARSGAPALRRPRRPAGRRQSRARQPLGYWVGRAPGSAPAARARARAARPRARPPWRRCRGARSAGTASRSVYTRAYRSRICSTSSSASAWGRETVGLKHPSTSSSASPGRRVGALVMRHAPRARQARSSEQSRPHLAPLATRGRSELCPGRSDPGRARESAGAARGRDPSAPAPRRVCATRGGARQGAAAGLVPQVQASSLRPCGGPGVPAGGGGRRARTRVANAVWPSCQRNSRVRMKGVGFLNSQRTTLVHWFRRSGRSRWLRIHCAPSAARQRRPARGTRSATQQP